jgi:hypothetical protein
VLSSVLTESVASSFRVGISSMEMWLHYTGRVSMGKGKVERKGPEWGYFKGGPYNDYGLSRSLSLIFRACHTKIY